MSGLNKVYTIKEAIERIHRETNKEVKDRKLMYLIKTGRIEAKKVGWIWVIPEVEVQKLVEQYKA